MAQHEPARKTSSGGLSDYEKLKKQHDIDEMWKQRGIWAKRGVYASIAMLIIIIICAAIAMLGDKK